MEFLAKAGAKALVGAAVGAGTAVMVVLQASKASPDLELELAGLLGPVKTLTRTLNGVARTWPGGGGGGARVEEEIAKSMERVRDASSAATVAERERDAAKAPLTGTLRGWAAAAATVVAGAAMGAVGGVVGAGSGEVRRGFGVAAMLVQAAGGGSKAVDPSAVEDPREAVARAWRAAQAADEADGGDGAMSHLSLVLRLTEASALAAGDVAVAWAEAWLVTARADGARRLVDAIADPDRVARMRAQVAAATAACEEAIKYLGPALQLFLAAQAMKLQHDLHSRASAERRELHADTSSTLQALVSQVSALQEQRAQQACHALSSSAPKPTAASQLPARVVARRFLGVQRAVAAERWAMRAHGELASLLRAAVDEGAHEADPPCNLRVRERLGKGMEAVVFTCTTDLAGGEVPLAAKIIPNTGHTSLSMDDASRNPYRNESAAMDAVSGVPAEARTNVVPLLVAFVARPSAAMLELVGKDASPEQRAAMFNEAGLPRKVQFELMPVFRTNLHHYMVQAQMHARSSGARGVPWLLMLSVLRGVADGLVQLRARGIVHMDAKTDNVLVDVDAEGGPEWDAPAGLPRCLPRVLVSDLGAARTVRPLRGVDEGGGVVVGDVDVPATLAQVREAGRALADAIDAQFHWSHVDGDDFVGIDGNPASHAPEVRRVAVVDGTALPLRKQTAFELGYVWTKLLTGEAPSDSYGESRSKSSAVIEREIAGLSRVRLLALSASAVEGAKDVDFAILSRVIGGLVQTDPSKRLSAEEARGVAWWLWERALARREGYEPEAETWEDVAGVTTMSSAVDETARARPSDEASAVGQASGAGPRADEASVATASASTPTASRSATEGSVSGASVTPRQAPTTLTTSLPAASSSEWTRAAVDGLCEAVVRSPLHDAEQASRELFRRFRVGLLDANALDEHAVLSASSVRLDECWRAATGRDASVSGSGLWCVAALALHKVNREHLVDRAPLAAFSSLLGSAGKDAEAAVLTVSQLARVAKGSKALGTSATFAALVQMLRSPPSDVDLQWAAQALAILAADDAENRRSIAGAGAIGPLVSLLREGDAEGKQWAAYALGVLAANDAENRRSIAGAGAIGPLVSLLRERDSGG
jgi:serine/threonine protein kinase